MQSLITNGDTDRRHFGTIQLTATRAHGGGITLAIWAGNNPVAAFSYSPGDLPAARTRYAEIRDMARAGTNAYVIADALVVVDAAESIIRDAAPAVTA